MISIICVYNDKKALEEQLLRSLDNFVHKEYELILLDSIELGFKCSAEGLNYGVEKAVGDILVFTHQDIYIKDENEFYQFCKYIDNGPKGMIIGAAGAIEREKRNYTNYTSGEMLDLEFVYECQGIRAVSCVDESFFGMSRETYSNHKFDSTLCDDWHLYAVEISLNARKNASKVMVYPIQIHHYSNGTISIKYMKGLLRIADRYRSTFKYIWTCCYKVRSSWLYTRMLYIVWYLHRKIIGKPLE